jgi:hypothetical protein
MNARSSNISPKYYIYKLRISVITFKQYLLISHLSLVLLFIYCWNRLIHSTLQIIFWEKTKFLVLIKLNNGTYITVHNDESECSQRHSKNQTLYFILDGFNFPLLFDKYTYMPINIVTDLLKTLLGNDAVNTSQRTHNIISVAGQWTCFLCGPY